jgi:hypothetical protein
VLFLWIIISTQKYQEKSLPLALGKKIFHHRNNNNFLPFRVGDKKIIIPLNKKASHYSLPNIIYLILLKSLGTA